MKNVKPGNAHPIVCLDAGHYGKYNRSPAIHTYYESDMVWKLHNYLADELEKYGIEVKKTRANQATDLGLKARGQASEGCDLFLSLHSNATGSSVNESVDYVVVYHLYDDAGTKIDDQSKELAKLLAPTIATTMGVKQGGKTQSRKGNGDWNGDGVMNDNYYGVLNGARLVDTPALILEHSFHTNTKVTQWLLDDGNLKKLANVEAKVIAEYFDVASNAQPEVTTLYRVQTGAYSVLANALTQVSKVETAGFETYLIKADDGLYKVQVGAYSNEANAAAQMAKLKAAGFSCFITTKSGTPVNKTELSITDEVTLKKLDKVRMAKDAPIYGKSDKFARWVYDTPLYIREISGDRVVVSTQKTGEITGAVHKKYLSKI